MTFNLQCSDGDKYDGIVSLWDRKQKEFKISLDVGKIQIVMHM